MFDTLIRPEVLAPKLGDAQWVVVDCRFDLLNTSSGQHAYWQGHIPGAVYAHLDDDLSGPPRTDNGRHPLPGPDAMRALFGRLGISEQTQVVVYDESGGAIAGRLWWMLRYMGHDAVAVLDGGWSAWVSAGMPVRGGTEQNAPTNFCGQPRENWLVLLDEVTAVPLLVDSRAPERYRGEIEPLDPRAGHIPGAVNFFYQRNWDADGYYLPPQELRAGFEDLIKDTPVEEVVFHCGSGVNACANILALAYAGLGMSRLYVGSWSEWSRNPDLPAITGG